MRRVHRPHNRLSGRGQKDARPEHAIGKKAVFGPGISRVLWSWRESNPRPSGGCLTRYDHSRGSGLRQPARRVEWIRDPAAGSFSDVSGLCLLSVVFPYRPPPLLVTGCDGQAPRGITARDDSLPTDLDQAARVRSSVSASLFLPRFWSLSNSGRTPKPPGPNVETDQPRDAVCFQGASSPTGE